MATPEEAPLLAASGLWRRDPRSERWLLAGVSLEIGRGERIALTGPSGSGKTVLLRTLALLDEPDRGTVRWCEVPVGDRGVPRFRSRVLYVQQRPTLVEGTVEENLRLPFGLRSHRRGDYRRSQGIEILESLGRSEPFLSQPVDDLSGGERQQVVLARTLLLEPSVLLLDEPTAALDRDSAERFAHQVEQWIAAAPGERAYLWVAHRGLETARTLRMEEGGLLEEAPPRRDEPSAPRCR